MATKMPRIAPYRPEKLLVGSLVMLLASPPAFAQRSGYGYGNQNGDDQAVRRCEDQLDFRMSREFSGRQPTASVDYRRAEIRRTGRTTIEVTGIGRYTRDNNDRGRDFTYNCTVDIDDGRVDARYQWSGSRWNDDSDYNRPDPGYAPSRSDSNSSAPEGRTFFSGAIISADSRKALDVESRGGNRDGANVQQWDFANGANQKWDIIDVGRGDYVIVSQSSNKVMAVHDNELGDGARIIQYRWNGTDSQKWRLERVGGGTFRIVNVGSSRCLDVTDASRQNGANVQQWTCSGGSNQQWRLSRQ